MINIFSFSIWFLLVWGHFEGVVFTPSVAFADRSTIQTTTTLVVQANLYFGNEDEQNEPVEADFYLLDESLIAILKKAKFKPIYADGVKRRASDADYLQAAAKVILSQSDDEEKILALLIDEAIERHQTAFDRTNQSGRGYLKAIKAGNYYLFGIKKIDGQIVVWHLPVAVKSGRNSIELDQNNAALIFSADE